MERLPGRLVGEQDLQPQHVARRSHPLRSPPRTLRRPVVAACCSNPAREREHRRLSTPRAGGQHQQLGVGIRGPFRHQVELENEADHGATSGVPARRPGDVAAVEAGRSRHRRRTAEDVERGRFARRPTSWRICVLAGGVDFAGAASRLRAPAAPTSARSVSARSGRTLGIFPFAAGEGAGLDLGAVEGAHLLVRRRRGRRALR